MSITSKNGGYTPVGYSESSLIAYGEIIFIHTMWESCSLLIFIIMFSVACEVLPFTSIHTEPMRAAVLDSTHSMHQCEILGALLLLKLLVSDLWTLPWTVMMFITPSSLYTRKLYPSSLLRCGVLQFGHFRLGCLRKVTLL